jgi:uncharacterized protein (TIGR00255 family)
MIKSMTGFGRAELKGEEKAILVEIRSLNNKYLKINTKIPESLSDFEEKIGKLLRDKMLRGTINLTLEHKTSEQEPKCFINKDVLKRYYSSVCETQEEISSKQDISLEKLISLPGVLEFKKDGGNGKVTDDLWLELEKSIKLAIDDLNHMKVVEGKNIQLEIEKWGTHISLLLDKIETMSANVVPKYRDRIQERISSLLEGREIKVEKSDLYKEIAIFADRCDISEELGRLRSHLLLLDNVMENEEPTGRKLEFIVQEMFREANTMAAKANDADIIKDVIEVKTEIERIKEQVFNVE